MEPGVCGGDSEDRREAHAVDAAVAAAWGERGNLLPNDEHTECTQGVPFLQLDKPYA